MRIKSGNGTRSNHKSNPRSALAPCQHKRPAAATDNQTLWFPHNSPHYERFMQKSPVLPGTTCLRRWVLRATPPLLQHGVGESLLIYTAASHP
ncbi:hypothetical protein AVEN_152559-1 [Araneus ventricosus]|uniref:Uncharacterized protein n=1 Tax=Araneus ventricosus TaxID=182803 RepID=A0A4Y2M913_ARAVE|nr:hypothetical protein AVEN_152559-1 [Araneus ventricosus]